MIPAEQDILIRDMARQFAQERLKPFAADWDREHRFPAEALKEMAKSPNQKMLLLPIEATGLLGSLAGIAELAKESLGQQQKSIAQPPLR